MRLSPALPARALLGRGLLALLVLLVLPLAPLAGPGSADTTPAAVYRLRVFADAAARDRLERDGYDVAGHALREGWVEVIADAAARARLEEYGYRVEVIEARAARGPLLQGSGGRASGTVPGANAAPGVDAPLPDTRYADPAEVEAFLDQTVAAHPSIARKFAIGTSREGRTIWALLVSDNAALDEDEPSILFNAAHHAREVMTPEIAMDIVTRLTEGYGVDPDMTRRVDAYQVLVVPVVNPDGVHRVHATDDFWRKNVRDNDANGTIDGQDGVDLNRNYEWGWGNQCQGSSSALSSETYRGPSEGSEPETRAMLALGRAYTPVFDVEYHSYAEAVYYAMSCDPRFAPTLTTVPGDGSIARVVGEDFAARIVQADGEPGYDPAPYGSRVDGTGRDQQYHEAGTISFVVEVNNGAEGGFAPDYVTWRDPTVQGHRAAWEWLIDRIDGPAIGGHVRDAASGLPVAADVTLDQLRLPDGKRLTSRADTGRFHLVVVPGAYTLRVRAPGYAEAAVPVNVGDVASRVDVELTPNGAATITEEPFEDAARVAAWTAGLVPGDTATTGRWTWAEPHGTHSGTVQANNLLFGAPRLDRTPGAGTKAMVTGHVLSSTITAEEVDNGTTTLLSPVYDLSGYYGVELTYACWFRKEATDTIDRLDLGVSADGVAWSNLEQLTAPTATPDASPAWVERRVLLDGVVQPGPGVRFRFRATDAGVDHVVEAAVDDLSLRGYRLATDGEVRGVRVAGTAGTTLTWDAVPGGAGVSYDVARGDLSQLSGGPPGVSLGALACIENDSADTSSASHPDPGVPAAGTGVFYVVRFRLGLSVGGWGRGSAGGERTAASGCP